MESLAELRVSAFESPERESSAVRPNRAGSLGGQREMFMVLVSAARQHLPRSPGGPLVLVPSLEGQASPGLGNMKETALGFSRNSVFFLKIGFKCGSRSMQKGELYPVVQLSWKTQSLLSLFDTGRGNLNSCRCVHLEPVARG